MTLVNGLVSNDLTQEEVLALFVDYVNKFCNEYCPENTLCIPLSIHYNKYCEYIQGNLRQMFPKVHWTITQQNNYSVWSSEWRSKS
jgi:hypothetical protein